MKLNSKIQQIKQHYTHLSNEFKIDKIGVFGSVAKQTDTENSDIDIIVEFKEPIGFKFIELVGYLETILDSKVDVLTPDGINNIRIKKVADDIKRNIIYV
jgi:predicted nucleotidyltransferase